MTENNAGRVHRLRGRRTVVAAMAMGLAATGSIVVATEAPAINPAVRPAVARPVLQVGSTGADVTADSSSPWRFPNRVLRCAHSGSSHELPTREWACR
ncbi:MAG: hypothetical protein V9E85_14620 [Candidatus Nanopelagicales bacterium]